MSVRCRIASVVVTAALLAGCAPDEFKSSPGFDGFLDRIGQVCYPDTIGPTLVRQWAQGYGPGGGGAGFIDATSKLYYGRMNPDTYRAAIVAFTDNGAATNKAISCIIGQLPATPPGSARDGGIPPGRDGVPPPPSSR